MNKFIFLLLPFAYCVSLHGQPLSSDSVVKRFEIYQQQSLTEKLYVHTDREFYLAGETIWFKVYCMEGMQHRPATISSIVYLELLDKNNKPAIQTMVSLHNGSGDGWMQLPFTVSSGLFRYRAYTSWMKNFDPDFYFEKPVTIVNSLKPLEPNPLPRETYDAQFFPEGGNLVLNLESKVAFQVTDRLGKGLSCRGMLVKNNRDTIASFATLKFGMGYFIVKPEAGNQYKVVFLVNDSIFTRPLPDPLRTGYVMHLENINENQLSVNIASANTEADSVMLFVHTRHAVKYAMTIKIHQGIASVVINRKSLGEGISRFTVFDRAARPVCERLYFIRPVEQLSITATTGKETFNTREKVNLSVQATDRSGFDGDADLSVSVIPADPLLPVNVPDIVSYTWLQADLKGNIESPQYYFSDTSKTGEQAADLLMLVHGWRRFTWQDVLKNHKPEPRFIPEPGDHIIYAKVTHAETGMPAGNIASYLSIPGNPMQLYAGRSDSDGITRYYVKDLFGKNELIFQVAGDTSHHLNIIPERPFSPGIAEKRLPEFILPAKAAQTLLDYSINVQVQHGFFAGMPGKLYDPATDTGAFYGTPDAKYLLDNYVRFSTMEEVLREYVPEVLVRRRREDFHLIMADGTNHSFLDDPLTMLNGIPVSTNKFMHYDPLKASELEVVKRRYVYGPLVFNGLVNVKTYHPDPEIMSGMQATIVDYDGVQYKKEFYSPVYETAEQRDSRLPDFRNTLFWSADAMKGKPGKNEISFYTADKKGEYIVIIQGMNSRGNMGAISFRFRVE